MDAEKVSSTIAPRRRRETTPRDRRDPADLGEEQLPTYLVVDGEYRETLASKPTWTGRIGEEDDRTQPGPVELERRTTGYGLP